MFGRTQRILGSQETRFNGGFSVGYGKPEPRFKIGALTAQLVLEGYKYQTMLQSSGGASPRDTTNYGLMALARYRWNMDEGGNGVYADIGFGVQVVNRLTFDLQSNLNTTPMLAVGGIFKAGDNEIMVGLRLLHISNGGTVKPNRGDNILFFTFGFRFFS